MPHHHPSSPRSTTDWWSFVGPSQVLRSLHSRHRQPQQQQAATEVPPRNSSPKTPPQQQICGAGGRQTSPQSPASSGRPAQPQGWRRAADTPRWRRWRPSCVTPLRNRLRSGRAERAAPLGRPSSSENDLKRCRQHRPPPLGAAALRRWPAAGERRWLAAGCNSANFRQSVNKY